MAETAVGLFGHSGTADAVVDTLRASGITSENIRIVSQPSGLAVNSATSTPSLDFEAALLRDLRAIGASDSESESYVDGVRHGKVLVFATGSATQADQALSIMNDRGAVEVEEFVGAVASLPTAVNADLAEPTITTKARAADRAKSEGAKVFSW
jgi:hypothetical protein